MTTQSPVPQLHVDGQRTRARRSGRDWLGLVFKWGAVALGVFFLINVFAVLASVVVDSFSGEWFDSWLPTQWTTKFYPYAWETFQLDDTLIVTIQVAVVVLVGSLLLGVPAAYVLARKNFPGKKLVMLSLLLPIMVPPLTYGVPLATLLYQWKLGGTLNGVILANLVHSAPFAILVLTPFIEQIDSNLESAARVFGARTRQVFTRILGPLIIPGLLAASVLVLVRTVAQFELTYLVSGPGNQTLVVALYYMVFGSGISPSPAISATAVVYMLTTLLALVVALRYVSPTQFVSHGKTTA